MLNDLKAWQARLMIIANRIAQVSTQLANTPAAQRLASNLLGVIVMAMDAWLDGYIVYRQRMANFTPTTDEEKKLVAWFKSQESYIGLVGRALDQLVPGWRSKHSGSRAAQVPPVKPPSQSAVPPASGQQQPQTSREMLRVIADYSDRERSIKPEAMVDAKHTLDPSSIQAPKEDQAADKKEEKRGVPWGWIVGAILLYFWWSSMQNGPRTQIRR